MNSYELMLILDAALDVEQTESLINKAIDTIKNNGGEVVKLEKWGRKRLAYEIKHKTEGFYAVAYFNAEPKAISELEHLLRITDSVIRYRVFRRPEIKKRPSREAVASGKS